MTGLTQQISTIYFSKTALIKQGQLQYLFKQAKTGTIYFFPRYFQMETEKYIQGKNHIHVHAPISVGQDHKFLILAFFYELPLTNPHCSIFF